jgi:hypothetical protein
MIGKEIGKSRKSNINVISDCDDQNMIWKHGSQSQKVLKN